MKVLRLFRAPRDGWGRKNGGERHLAFHPKGTRNSCPVFEVAGTNRPVKRGRRESDWREARFGSLAGGRDVRR